jgi:hypothetical protein
MTKMKLLVVLTYAAFAFGAIAAQEAVKREPMTFTLDCAGGDCPLLKGIPQTSGMRGGSVKLKPGESVGWHSTAANEETLVILHGLRHSREITRVCSRRVTHCRMTETPVLA